MIFNNYDVIFEYEDVIPWFGRSGFGDQIKSSVNFQKLWKRNIIEIVERLEYRGGKWIKV